MSWAGITYDRDYCDLTANNFSEFYDCLDKYTIKRKADYCDFTHKKDQRYFGHNRDHNLCLVNESVPTDASECNLHLKEDQRKLYFNNTLFNIDKHI